MNTRWGFLPRARMRPLSHIGIGLTCTCFLLSITLFASLGHAQESTVLVGSGSSVPAPLYSRLAQEYNKKSPSVQVKYLPLGTSEGIKQISHGSGDFAAGEVALSANERSETGLVEVPSVLIGIVPIYHVPGAPPDLKFSGEVLAEIFLGEIKNWNDPQITKLNPGANLPDMPIHVYNRPGGKGSNYVLTEFLSKVSPRFRSRIGVSPSPNWPVGTPAERSSDIADKVKADTGSIGYVELQYAVKGNIAQGKVLNPAGNYVKASAETIAAACRAEEAPGWEKFGASLTNAPGADSYPITSFSWVYLRSTSSTDARRVAALQDFLNWMFTDGQLYVGQEGYPALPPQMLAKVKAKANSLR
jgi:phosphate transport system substrate-binding protein